MTSERNVPTALGQPIALGKAAEAAGLKFGPVPLVLQVQPYGYIPLETPEQLRQFEQDLRKFYGISVDGLDLRGHACETCSCGCTDDCGFI
jgi:hypothetical protein